MRILFWIVLVVGAVLIVATPLAAMNLLRIWPVQWFYAAGIVVYLIIVALFVVWRRKTARA